MNPILLYGAKMILISGLLYGYYVLFLRNAPFHRYNRVYLFGITVISLILPLLHIPLPGISGNATPPTMTLLHAITVGNWGASVTLTRRHGFWQNLVNGKELVPIVYATISGYLFTVLFRSLRYIHSLSKRNPSKTVDGIRIIFTDEPGTPFSFLNRIFWNRQLDLDSTRGRQVFRHERYHVRQRHSLDSLLLEILNAVFWFNPFIHFIRREIKVTHEFLADQYAISGSDKFEYAELLVWQALGVPRQFIAHSFFNTHLKRRITMLTQFSNTRPAYFSRIMVFPLLLLLCCAFATSLRHPDHPFPARLVTSAPSLPSPSSIITSQDSMPPAASAVQTSEAEYPGGQEAWIGYLNKNFRYPSEAFHDKVQGKVVIQFRVDVDGKVSEIKTIGKDPGAGLAAEAKRMIAESGKWTPANAHGRAIVSYKKQPIIYRLDN